MKPVIFAIIGMTFYGLSAVILEQKLAKVHVIPNLICSFSLVLLLTITVWGIMGGQNKPEIKIPLEKGIWIAFIAFSTIIFLGHYFYTSAYTSGGDVVVLSSILALSPVAAALFKNIWRGGFPNKVQIIGYLFALVAVILITRGGISSVRN